MQPSPTPPCLTSIAPPASRIMSLWRRMDVALLQDLAAFIITTNFARLKHWMTVRLSTRVLDPAASGRRRRLAGALTRSCSSSPSWPLQAAVGVGASGVPWPRRRRERPSPWGSRTLFFPRQRAAWPPPPPPGGRSCHLTTFGHAGNGQLGVWCAEAAVSSLASGTATVFWVLFKTCNG